MALHAGKRAVKRLLHGLASIGFGLYGAWSWLRGPRPRLPLQPHEIRRILVIRLDLLGDIVFSTPAVETLSAAFPNARIDALVLPYTASILAHVPAVAVVHQLHVNRYRRPQGWLRCGDLLACIRALRAQRYDLAVGLAGLMGGVFAVLSGARWRAGYVAETYRGCYNLPVPGARYRRAQHEVEYCLDLVRALGVAVPAPGSRVPTLTATARFSPPVAPSSVPNVPSTGRPGFPGLQPETPYAVLVPGASNGSAKRWPPPFWSALGDELARERGLAIVLNGSSFERALAESVAHAMTVRPVNLAGRTSIPDLIDLLAGAAVVVAGDTGPLHLAAALGVPALGIYGPTDTVNTGPRGGRIAAVRLGLSCSPCYDLRSPADCKLPDRSVACMWGIPPERVFAAVCELLDGSQPPKADRG